MVMKMRDRDLRELVLNELYQKYQGDEDTRIVNEMGIENGASRVDVAVINGILHGYELKSESDNLKRLPRQVEYYNRLFERMTIVVDTKYINDVKNIVPSWWGIVTIKKNKNGLRQIRKGRKVSYQNEETLLNLLWKEDLNTLVDVLGYPKNFKLKRKHELYQIFIADNRKDIIKKYIYDVLKKRAYN